MKTYKNIIIGSGPSGLMCANQINSKETLLIEKNFQLGGKIKVSGNGRCNVTNNKSIDQIINHVVCNGKFLYPALTNFGPQNIIAFFQENDVKLKEEAHNKIFPVTNNSQDIIDALIKNLIIDIVTDFNVTLIEKKDNFFIINNMFKSKNLIIATGGTTFNHLETTGDGYEFAKSFDHTITPLFASETPLVSNDLLIQEKTFQGISLPDCTIEIKFNGKKKKTLTHDLLITHFGLSGPLALRASYFVNKALQENKKVDIDIINYSNYPNKIKSYLIENELSDLTFNIVDTKGFKVAFVTSGGISLKEIDPRTYQSKIVENLFFIGEVLDINAFTGGYNITSFLSQGHLCGQYIMNRKKNYN